MHSSTQEVKTDGKEGGSTFGGDLYAMFYATVQKGKHAVGRILQLPIIGRCIFPFQSFIILFRKSLLHEEGNIMFSLLRFENLLNDNSLL